jgi:hypothetical protein
MALQEGAHPSQIKDSVTSASQQQPAFDNFVTNRTWLIQLPEAAQLRGCLRLKMGG